MLKISDATDADASRILMLQKRAYESEARLYDDWFIPPMTQSIESLLEEIRLGFVLKAVQNGSIVGSVRGHMDGHTCEIGRLFVAPAVRRQGFGSLLLQAIEQKFPHATQYRLFTGHKSESNIRLYRHHGYEVTDFGQISAGVQLVTMYKQR